MDITHLNPGDKCVIRYGLWLFKPGEIAQVIKFNLVTTENITYQRSTGREIDTKRTLDSSSMCYPWNQHYQQAITLSQRAQTLGLLGLKTQRYELIEHLAEHLMPIQENTPPRARNK